MKTFEIIYIDIHDNKQEAIIESHSEHVAVIIFAKDYKHKRIVSINQII